MNEPGSSKPEELPPWLPLLLKPYQNLLGSKNSWDLRMPDGSPVRIERGTQGLQNTFFRVRLLKDVFACKLFVQDERNRALRQWIALQALHAAGLTVAPEPVAYAPEGPLPQPVVVYRWIPGTPLTEAGLANADFEAVVGGLGQVHRSPIRSGYELPGAWRQPANAMSYLDEIKRYFAQVRAWGSGFAGPAPRVPSWVADLHDLLPQLESVLDRAQRAVAGASIDANVPKRVLVRGDGSLDNVLRIQSGQIVFLDWQFSGLGDGAYDLAEMRWHPRAAPLEQASWEAAMTHYPLPSDDPGFAARLAVYNELLPAWWVGRSAVHVLEGSGQLGGWEGTTLVPRRMYRRVRDQLDVYLAALGLINLPLPRRREDD